MSRTIFRCLLNTPTLRYLYLGDLLSWGYSWWVAHNCQSNQEIWRNQSVNKCFSLEITGLHFHHKITTFQPVASIHQDKREGFTCSKGTSLTEKERQWERNKNQQGSDDDCTSKWAGRVETRCSEEKERQFIGCLQPSIYDG